MDKFKQVLLVDFNNKVKELSTDPLNIKKHFNTFFIYNESIMLKMQKVSRECKFAEDGV